MSRQALMVKELGRDDRLQQARLSDAGGRHVRVASDPTEARRPRRQGTYRHVSVRGVPRLASHIEVEKVRFLRGLDGGRATLVISTSPSAARCQAHAYTEPGRSALRFGQPYAPGSLIAQRLHDCGTQRTIFEDTTMSPGQWSDQGHGGWSRGCGLRSSPTAFAAVAPAWSKRWPYRSRVNATEAWPRRRLIVSGSTPASMRCAT